MISGCKRPPGSRFGANACSRITTLFGASGVRILPHFAEFCRAKTRILFVFSASEITLDQHIGVRIPGGQPNNRQYSCAFLDISVVASYRIGFCVAAVSPNLSFSALAFCQLNWPTTKPNEPAPVFLMCPHSVIAARCEGEQFVSDYVATPTALVDVDAAVADDNALCECDLVRHGLGFYPIATAQCRSPRFRCERLPAVRTSQMLEINANLLIWRKFCSTVRTLHVESRPNLL